MNNVIALEVERARRHMRQTALNHAVDAADDYLARHMLGATVFELEQAQAHARSLIESGAEWPDACKVALNSPRPVA